LVVILLVVIYGYSINGYWWLLMVILLVAIILMIINNYSIGDCFKLNYHKLLMVIGDYFKILQSVNVRLN
jgi:membrane-bound ClpP family serine protease